MQTEAAAAAAARRLNNNNYYYYVSTNGFTRRIFWLIIKTINISTSSGPIHNINTAIARPQPPSYSFTRRIRCANNSGADDPVKNPSGRAFSSVVLSFGFIVAWTDRFDARLRRRFFNTCRPLARGLALIIVSIRSWPRSSAEWYHSYGRRSRVYTEPESTAASHFSIAKKRKLRLVFCVASLRSGN